MAMTAATIARNASCDGLVDLIDIGPQGTGGIMELRTGTKPATPDDPATGTLLATVTFSATAFGNAGAVNPGEAIANAITSDTNAAANGVAGWFRIYDRTAVTRQAIVDGEITTTGGGGDLELDNTTIVAGGTVAIASFKLTMPINC